MESSHVKACQRVRMKTGYVLIPLLSGKIQYAELLRDHNIDQIRE